MSLNLLDSRSATTSPPGGNPAAVPTLGRAILEHPMTVCLAPPGPSPSAGARAHMARLADHDCDGTSND